MESKTCLVAAFYKFVSLPDFQQRRGPLRAHCQDLGLKGSILLSEEGINATIAGSEEGIASVLARLEADPKIGKLAVKRSWTDEPPFYRMKIGLKRELAPLGIPSIDPKRQTGERVAPERWNDLVRDPEVLLVDSRNGYEVAIGTFPGAIDPQTRSFRSFPGYADAALADRKAQPIALFCTGGIRCEKSTAYLRQQGFQQVYQLDGGILAYLERVPPEESLWQGECFVFDKRVSLNHRLEPGRYGLCHGCRQPLSPEDRQSPKYEPGVCCPRCHDRISDEKKARAAERQRQIAIARGQNRPHLGAAF